MVVGAAAVNGSRFFALGLGFVSIPLIARWLGPTEFGVYSASMASLAVVTIVGGMGLFDGVRWMVARRGGTPEAAMSEASKASRIAVAPIAVAALLAVFVMGRTGQPSLDGILLILGLLGLIATTYLDIAKSALWGRSSELPAELLVIFRNSSFVVLALVAAAYGLGGTGVFAAYVIATTIAAAAFWYWLVRPFRPSSEAKHRESEPPSSDRTALIRFSLQAAALGLFITLLLQGGVLALGFSGDHAATGIYRAALSIAEVIFLVPLGVQLVLMHRVAASRSGGLDTVNEILRRPAQVSAAIAAWAGALALSNADSLAQLVYGNAFDGAAAQIQVLIPGGLALAITRPVIGVAQGLGEMRPILIVALVAGLSSTVGSWGSLQALGPASVPYVTSAVYLGAAVALWAVARSGGFAIPRQVLGMSATIFAATLLGSRMVADLVPAPLPHLVLATLTGSLTAAATFLAIQVARRRG